MKIEFTNKGKLEIDMHDIISEVVSETPDDRLWELVEMLGWQERIFKMVSVALAEEFSRDNYNTHLHEARELFLTHVKQEEIKFYASKLSNILDDARRHSNSFWTLYHWCNENHVFQEHPNHPSWDKMPEKYDPDMRIAIDRICRQALLEQFPDLKD